MDIKQKFGIKIKELRKSKKLSQEKDETTATLRKSLEESNDKLESLEKQIDDLKEKISNVEEEKEKFAAKAAGAQSKIDQAHSERDRYRDELEKTSAVANADSVNKQEYESTISNLENPLS